MNLSFSSRGFAAETVILAIVLLGGASWFGVSKIKDAYEKHELKKAVADTEEKARLASESAGAALKERDAANVLRQKADDALADKVAKEAAVGRTIQRSSTEGVTVAKDLPDTTHRTHLLARFDEIDTATAGLVGKPAENDVERWRVLAAEALAGRAAAQAQLDAQKGEIERLVGELKEARLRSDQLTADAKQANTTATNAQIDATAKSKDAAQSAKEAKGAADELKIGNDVITGLKTLLFVALGVWVFAGGLKALTNLMPGDSPLKQWLGTAANAAAFALAPAAVASEIHAHRETNEVLVNTGEALSDLNEANKTALGEATKALDVTFPVKHQRRVRAACLAAAKRKAAAKVDCEAGST